MKIMTYKSQLAVLIKKGRISLAPPPLSLEVGEIHENLFGHKLEYADKTLSGKCL